jgi:hypothetical protein
MGRNRSNHRCEMYTCKQAGRWRVWPFTAFEEANSCVTCSNHIVTALNKMGGRGYAETIGDDNNGAVTTGEKEEG